MSTRKQEELNARAARLQKALDDGCIYVTLDETHELRREVEKSSLETSFSTYLPYLLDQFGGSV
jgi:hypothetical protein